jgi:hypothetical protein
MSDEVVKKARRTKKFVFVSKDNHQQVPLEASTEADAIRALRKSAMEQNLTVEGNLFLDYGPITIKMEQKPVARVSR